MVVLLDTRLCSRRLCTAGAYLCIAAAAATVAGAGSSEAIVIMAQPDGSR